MKLRLHGNSLRLRLSQPEVERLKQSGMVEDTVTFAPGQALRYSIEAATASGITADFSEGRIRVHVPADQARSWVDSDEVGIAQTGAPLDILIEKDFQCLHRGPEPGAFPHPLADPKMTAPEPTARR